MIFCLLDPALFLIRSSPKEVKESMKLINKICKESQIELIDFPYLDEISKRLIKSLDTHLLENGHHEARYALNSVTTLIRKARACNPEPISGVVWQKGFLHLFDLSNFGSTNWETIMFNAVIQALHINQNVIIITPKIAGRNLQPHQTGHSTLEEITRWALYVQPAGIGPKRIRCIHHPRNLDAEWTTRYDWRLPDRGKFPFCVPDGWCKQTTQAVKTVASKPAWIDRFDQGWASPNTPGTPYHWDVYLSPEHETMLGVAQINVTRFDAPASQGTPGTIHHIPSDKQAHFKPGNWTCP
ncbi:MAG: hypothetical protein HQL91_07460 [Magnetococcales bacterium]|nr:hypothetical protein [Magnetococcales bacterium]